jgi:hypothetical protein
MPNNSGAGSYLYELPMPLIVNLLMVHLPSVRCVQHVHEWRTPPWAFTDDVTCQELKGSERTILVTCGDGNLGFVNCSATARWQA